MRFKEVNYNDLKLGQKYIISHVINKEMQTPSPLPGDKCYVGIFNGYCNYYSMREISNLRKTYISYLNNINYMHILGDMSFNKHTQKKKYLILESQIETIQNNMESRALNIILRMILGDNNFSY